MLKLKLSKTIYLLIILFVSSILTSCSSPKFKKYKITKITNPKKSVNKQADWILYQKTHQGLIKGNWLLEGVVGINIKGKGENARIVWERTKNSHEINLYGPLNIGSVTIKYSRGIYHFINNNGDKFKDSDPERLLNKLLGYSLPILGADYWVLGMIDPNYKQVSYSSLNEYGSLSNLSQAGWGIKYLNYKVYNGIMMPNIIIFYNSEKDLQIKLVIKKWAFK